MSRLQTPCEFWACVDIRGVDECWLWNRSVSAYGYGRRGPGVKERSAHRAAFTHMHGRIPPGKIVRHRCEGRYAAGDVTYRRCCNPNHLVLGTQHDNIMDALATGRMAPRKGEAASAAKLSDADVLHMRAWFAVGGWQQKDLALAFGVSNATVCNIISGKSRGGLPE